jgi:hypothetical protein
MERRNMKKKEIVKDSSIKNTRRDNEIIYLARNWED